MIRTVLTWIVLTLLTILCLLAFIVPCLIMPMFQK
jgi:hypothetical protein